MGKLEILEGVPLTQEGREFTPEIVSIVTPFARENGLDVLDVTQEIVARIMGHNKTYLREFGIGDTQKEIAYILEGCDYIEVVQPDDGGKLVIYGFAGTGGVAPGAGFSL